MPALGNVSYKMRLKRVLGDHRFTQYFTHLSPTLFKRNAS